MQRGRLFAAVPESGTPDSPFAGALRKTLFVYIKGAPWTARAKWLSLDGESISHRANKGFRNHLHPHGEAFDVQGCTNVRPAQGCAVGPDLCLLSCCNKKVSRARWREKHLNPYLGTACGVSSSTPQLALRVLVAQRDVKRIKRKASGEKHFQKLRKV